jgi:phosphatidylinositol dimannoside acyltransferase
MARQPAGSRPGTPTVWSRGLQRGLARAARSAADQTTTLGYLTGWRVVRLLPERRAQAAFRRVADEIHRRQGPGVLRLRANLHRVRPDLDPGDLDELTHAAVRSYLRYWCESFRLPAWPMDEVVARTRTVGEHHLRDGYARGHGAVVPLPHMANWDWAGAWACATGMPVSTVAERLRPERLYDEFVAYRTTLGMQILPLTGGDAALPRLEQWVRGGRLVCLLADRDLSRTGVEVQLCGAPARLPRGPALLARRTGAPLVPVTLHYSGADLTLTFHAPVPHAEGAEGLVRMTQGVADAFTVALREHPQDWHMMQKVFAEDLHASR